MLDIVYLNGKLIPLKEAKISILDRGFLFGDAVYEVIPVYNGKPFQAKAHLRRLSDSLFAIKMKPVASIPSWLEIFDKLIDANHGGNMQLYLQISRGTDETRSHDFSNNLTPTVFIGTIRFTPKTIDQIRPGLSAIMTNDTRAHRCYIKTTSLIANILARVEAGEEHADEAIFVRDGYVTEATMRNVFMVKDSIIKTPAKTPKILHGITRDVVIEIAKDNHLPLEETNLTVEDFQNADEIWMTSSTLEIVPVVNLNGKPVGTGKAGPIWEKVISLYQYKKADV